MSIGARLEKLVLLTALILFSSISTSAAGLPYELGLSHKFNSMISLAQSGSGTTIEISNLLGNIVPLSNDYSVGEDAYVPVAFEANEKVFLLTMARVDGSKLVLGPFYNELFYILGRMKLTNNFSVSYFYPSIIETKRVVYELEFTSSMLQRHPERTMSIGATLPFASKNYEHPRALEQTVVEIIDISLAPMALAGSEEISDKTKNKLKDRALTLLRCVNRHSKEQGFSSFTSNMLTQHMLMRQHINLVNRSILFLNKSSAASKTPSFVKSWHFDSLDSRAVLMELKKRTDNSGNLNVAFDEYITSLTSTCTGSEQLE